VYADENIHAGIVEGLKRRGVTIWSVQEVKKVGLKDEEQLEYATAQGACFLTHDDDLLRVADRWLKMGRRHAGVLYVHQQHLSIGEIIRKVKMLVDIVNAEEMENRIEFL